MMRSLVLPTALVSVLLALAPAGPASAAPPAIDSITQARALGVPPRTFIVDTSQATSSPDDGECVNGASVWFRAKPTVTRTVRLSTLGSNYDTTVAVFRGPQTARVPIACADDSFNTTPDAAVQVRLVAGRTYWFAVSACCDRRSTGGRMVLRTFVPRPAGLAVKVTSVRTGAVSGRLLLEGTMRCTTPSEVFLSLAASQRVNGGANVARGSADTLAICLPGADRPWRTRIDSESGWAFRPGDIAITRLAGAWDGFTFADLPEATSIHPVTEQPAARAR